MNKQKIIFILFAIFILLGVGAGLLFVYRPSVQTPASEEGNFSHELTEPQTTAQESLPSAAPAETAPQTNPFEETKTNPFRDIKTNPFD